MRARLGLAAAIAAPVGALSALLSPLARRPLRWGRKLYRYLANRARAAREARDGAIEQQHQDEAALAAAPENTELSETTTPTTRRGAVDEADLLALVAAIAAGTVPGTTAGSPEGAGDMEFFDFRQHAEDMYNAAVNGEAEGPGAMMRVLKAFANMPETLELIAKTFEVVAQRCDDELPLHFNVTEELESVRTLIRQASKAAESIEPVFRARHKVEIARHEDPRTGEDKWDVGSGS